MACYAIGSVITSYSIHYTKLYEIACGAVSGFHSLVSSGTTPKMIEQESQAVVGYAAMLLESFVGVMALIAASVLIPGDYLAINTSLSAEALTSMGFAPARISELSQLVEVRITSYNVCYTKLLRKPATIHASCDENS